MDLNEIVSVGKEMGLSGKELKEFVENERREQLSVQTERKRVEAEVRKEEAKLKKEADERQAKLREREAQLKKEADEREVELLRLRLQVAESSGPEAQSSGQSKGLRPKLPKFDEQRDDMDQFLRRFEMFAESAGWPRDSWSVNLSPLLTGMGLSVYTSLPPSEMKNYVALKRELLHRYELTEDGFRKKFRESKPERGETVFQFVARLNRYLDRWLELAEVEKTFESLNDLLVREQFIATCSPDMALFLKERRPSDAKELTKLAQQYMEAHGGGISSVKHTKASVVIENKANGRMKPITNDKPANGRVCWRCNKAGHVAKDCRSRVAASAMDRREGSFMGMQRRTSPPPEWRRSHRNFNSWRNGDTDPNRQSPNRTQNGNKSAALCRGLRIESNHLEKFLEEGEIKLADGNSIAVISGGAYTGPDSSKDYGDCVGEGFVGDTFVRVLRDTGCNTAAVKRDLVLDEQLTGEWYSCILIDGTIRRFPIAEIEVDTPYFTGKVEAMCMRKPIFELVLGNLPGVKLQPNSSWHTDQLTAKITGAVITRSQAAKEKNPIKPLRVPADIMETLDTEQLENEQQNDASLKRCWELVKNKQEVTTRGKGTFHMEVRRGILYRIFKRTNHAHSPEVKQVVVPAKYRDQVMALAHEAIVGGHLGANKTVERITSSFHWPGITSDVIRFCRSCDICQRTIPKGKVPKTPLGEMPLMEEPFHRVAVDLIGPINPMSSSKNRYILTVVDYATRYPEAVALPKIETERVAEALLEIFCRIGFPKEILSDQGTQFTSDLMKEVCRLVSVRQLFTTPYNPRCNGLCERMNGVLKSMVKKMCQERPTDWDRYLPAVLFAYREVPQSSTGFSPFELLYGRTVRGPMQILKELWTEAETPETRNTYQYVLDLRNRLEETCKIARESLGRAQLKYKHHYDKKTKDRRFKVGEKVTVLLPTDHNKLLLQWKGPYEVEEVMNANNYRVKVNRKTKIYHANLLKAYEQRKSTNPVVSAGLAVIEPEEDDTELGSNDDLLHRGSLEGEESYLDVRVDDNLSAMQKEQANEILYKYRDVLTDKPGATNLVTHSIELITSEPTRVKPYAMPFSKRQDVEREVKLMLDHGIIEAANSPYNSPVVLVGKRDGGVRFCIDYRKLNAITKFDTEPMCNIDEIMTNLSQSEYFTKLDLSKGYWQIPVNPRHRHLTAFTTPSGCYQFRKMPFGLVNSGASFNRMMRLLLKGTINTEHYIDDMLQHSRTWEEHLKGLENVLRRIQDAGLTVRPSKCFVGFKEMEFLGHKVGGGTLAVDDEKIAKINEAERPMTKKQVRSFLGLAGYYRKFIPNFAEIAAPLTDLTKKGHANKVNWTQHQEGAFKTLKDLLSRAPILRLPDLDRPFIVQSDASDTGVGAALLQEYDDGRFPVMYASRKLLPRERNYSVIERECLAIIFAVTKFQNYLYGKEFLLNTDHAPLAYLQKCRPESGRLMRWALFLQNYRFRIVAIKGSENKVADYLSRQ